MIVRAFFMMTLAASTAHAMTLQELNQKLGQLYQTVYKNSKTSGPLLGWDNATDDSNYFAFALKSFCALKESSDGAGIANTSRFTIINMDLDAHKKRFTVYDIKNKKLAFQTWTTHGLGSTASFDIRLGNVYGALNESLVHYRPKAPPFFSNRSESGQSTVGMAIAADTTYYSEKNYGGLVQGESLRLKGVDGSLNDKLLSRGIVIHRFEFSPWEPNKAIPTSLGCFMIPVNQIDQILSLVKGTAVMIDHERLDSSINDKTYQAEKANLETLLTTFEGNVRKYQAQYPHLTPAFFADRRKQLKGEIARLQTKIEETYRYFKQSSKYIGMDPDNVDACAAALGIN